MYISTELELKDLVSSLHGCRILAIDTEFLREKVYYPELCLLQIATPEIEAIIDPLAVKDLSALAPILDDSTITKVFHAGDQDRELIYQTCGIPASPVFDTQIAAAYLGLPQQIGYASLVSNFCGIDLPKTDSLSDWSQRPLTKNQLSYAIDDVHYLPSIYDTMVKQLSELKRMSWLDDDFAALANPARYEIDYEMMWKKVKRSASLSPRQLVCVRSLAQWRERQAQLRNLPRKWVISDEIIVAIARRQPQSVEDMYHVRGARERISSTAAEELIKDFVANWERPDEWPEKVRHERYVEDIDEVVDLMNALLHIRAKESRIAASLLGAHDDLEALASGYLKNSPLLQGWRYDILGRELVELFQGNIGLKITDGHVEVVTLEDN